MFLVYHEYCDWESHSFEALFVVHTEEEAQFATKLIKEEIEKVSAFWIDHPGDWKPYSVKEYKSTQVYLDAFEKIKSKNLEKAKGIFKLFPAITEYNGEYRVSFPDPKDERHSIEYHEIDIKTILCENKSSIINDDIEFLISELQIKESSQDIDRQAEIAAKYGVHHFKHDLSDWKGGLL